MLHVRAIAGSPGAMEGCEKLMLYDRIPSMTDILVDPMKWNRAVDKDRHQHLQALTRVAPEPPMAFR